MIVMLCLDGLLEDIGLRRVGDDERRRVLLNILVFASELFKGQYKDSQSLIEANSTDSLKGRLGSHRWCNSWWADPSAGRRYEATMEGRSIE